MTKWGVSKMTKINIMENDKGKWERRTGRTERVPGQAEGYGMTTGRRWGGMYFWVDRTDRAEDGEDGVGTGHPLTVEREHFKDAMQSFHKLERVVYCSVVVYYFVQFVRGCDL